MNGLGLYTYFRSSAAYRVRIALNIKGLDYHSHLVHLLKDGGEQHSAAYRQLNPQGLIPALLTGEYENPISQSIAIIEYLDESYPQPSLLPDTAIDRAWVRSLALMVCCDIHPLNNLRVHAYLKDVLDIDDAARQAWYQHWVSEGLAAIENRLAASNHNSPFSYGDRPGMADLCLIPQIYNAIRFECDISRFTTLARIYSNCMALEAFSNAAPENQPDHE